MVSLTKWSKVILVALLLLTAYSMVTIAQEPVEEPSAITQPEERGETVEVKEWSIWIDRAIRNVAIYLFCYLVAFAGCFYLCCCVLFSMLLKRGHHPRNASNISLAWTWLFPIIVADILYWWLVFDLRFEKNMVWLLLISGILLVILLISLFVREKSAAYK